MTTDMTSGHDRADTGLVPIHPEPVADDERSLRWVMPAGTLSFIGPPASVPRDLQRLLDDGVLETLCVEPTAVRASLCASRSWRQEGATVRAALQSALAEPSRWLPQAAQSPDDVLRAVVAQVLAGDVGVFVRSHGGEISLLDVHDGTVEVSMTGACEHCPASRFTLGARFERALRAAYPDLRAVTSRT